MTAATSATATTVRATTAGPQLRRGQRSQARGPKGYKRSDERMKEDVCDRICAIDVDASNVEVAVKDCEVTLTGSVTDRSLKYWDQAVNRPRHRAFADSQYPVLTVRFFVASERRIAGGSAHAIGPFGPTATGMSCIGAAISGHPARGCAR